MSQPNLSTVATRLIVSYGNTARNVVDTWRNGGERVAAVMEQRWKSALKESSPQLTAEVRTNAMAAQQFASALYLKGLDITTRGAGTVIDNVVGLAGKGVQQVAANAAVFEEKTGALLTQVAAAVVPAALAVSRLAEKIEEKSSELASRAAGHDASTAAVKRVTPFHKARSARKAA